MMAVSNGQPASVTWDYDRVELVADGIVHAIGVSLGVVGAFVIVVVAANSAPLTTHGQSPAPNGFCAASITPLSM